MHKSSPSIIGKHILPIFSTLSLLNDHLRCHKENQHYKQQFYVYNSENDTSHMHIIRTPVFLIPDQLQNKDQSNNNRRQLQA